MVFEQVKVRAADKNISIAALEKACGLKTSTIIKWREHIPRADNLQKVAQYLGCTMDELMKEDGS